MDFGSLICAGLPSLSRTFPGVAARYRKYLRLTGCLTSFKIPRKGSIGLSKPLPVAYFKNVFAVADDDQIIYQWNGASYQQIQRFRADYLPMELQLPTNYRCPPSIVAAANRLVIHNSQRTTSKRPLEAGKTALRYPSDQHMRIGALYVR